MQIKQNSCTRADIQDEVHLHTILIADRLDHLKPTNATTHFNYNCKLAVKSRQNRRNQKVDNCNEFTKFQILQKVQQSRECIHTSIIWEGCQVHRKDNCYQQKKSASADTEWRRKIKMQNTHRAQTNHI
jgi:hypothetical protein